MRNETKKIKKHTQIIIVTKKNLPENSGKTQDKNVEIPYNIRTRK
jgi:hypothetical protein